MDNKQRCNFHDIYLSGDESKIKQILKTFPSSVIKFYSDKEYNLDILKEQKIWFSSPNYFNDPLDCVVNVDYDETAYEIFKKKSLKIFTEEAAEEFLNMNDVKSFLNFLIPIESNKYKKNMKALIDTAFVSCFSEPDNLTSLRMWGYYANSHKGFCSEYGMQDFYNPSNIRELLPIIYSNNYSFYSKYKSDYDLRKLKYTLFFTKSLEWNYEKEWRLLKLDKNYAGQPGFLSSFLTPKRIFLGCKMEKGFKENLLSICKQMKIDTYEVYIFPNSYNLRCRKIDL